MAFGFGWTPCIGPILGSILALASTEETIFRAIILLSFYSLGLAIPFILSGYLMQRFLMFSKNFKKNINLVSKGGGVILLITGILTFITFDSKSQNSNRVYRIAKIKVDINKLVEYKQALHEQMKAAIEIEPGVLSYTAVADKKDPTLITILEVYSNHEAYQSHILTSHFRKYKETVKDMVLSLELVDTDLVVSAKKSNY